MFTSMKQTLLVNSVYLWLTRYHLAPAGFAYNYIVVLQKPNLRSVDSSFIRQTRYIATRPLWQSCRHIGNVYLSDQYLSNKKRIRISHDLPMASSAFQTQKHTSTMDMNGASSTDEENGHSDGHGARVNGHANWFVALITRSLIN